MSVILDELQFVELFRRDFASAVKLYSQLLIAESAKLSRDTVRKLLAWTQTRTCKSDFAKLRRTADIIYGQLFVCL